MLNKAFGYSTGPSTMGQTMLRVPFVNFFQFVNSNLGPLPTGRFQNSGALIRTPNSSALIARAPTKGPPIYGSSHTTLIRINSTPALYQPQVPSTPSPINLKSYQPQVLGSSPKPVFKGLPIYGLATRDTQRPRAVSAPKSHDYWDD